MGRREEAVRTFPIGYSRWLWWLFWALGMANGRVELDRGELRVHMGWVFRSWVPRDSVRQAVRSRDVWWAIGVHTDFRGRWLINGSAHDIVALLVDPPARGRLFGIPVRVLKLGLGLADPAGFLEVLGAPGVDAP